MDNSDPASQQPPYVPPQPPQVPNYPPAEPTPPAPVAPAIPQAPGAPDYAAPVTPPVPQEYNTVVQPQQFGSTNSAAQVPTLEAENPNKSYLVALLLSHFLGNIGADRFYLGKTKTAIIKLLTGGGLGIWTVIDELRIAFNKMHAAGDDRPLEGYAHNRHWVKVVAVVLVLLDFVVLAALIPFLIFMSSARLNTNAQDTGRKLDLATVVSKVNEYNAQHGAVASDQQFASGDFTNGLTTLQKSDVKYQASPLGCDNLKVMCTTFSVSGPLSNGTNYTINP